MLAHGRIAGIYRHTYRRCADERGSLSPDVGHDSAAGHKPARQGEALGKRGGLDRGLRGTVPVGTAPRCLILRQAASPRCWVEAKTTFCDGQHIGLDGRPASCCLGDPWPLASGGRMTPFSGRKNMSNQQQTCDYCGGPTAFATEIPPLGRDPGHKVFFCDPCKRHTWTTWYIAEIQQLKNSRSNTGSR